LAASLLLSPFLMMLGKPRESLAAAAPILEGSPEAAEVGAAAVGYSPYPFLLAWRAIVLSVLGRPAEGRGDLERALELAQARPSAELLGWCHLNAATVEHALGNPTAAMAHVRAALGHQGTASLPGLNSSVQTELGAAHLVEGRWGEAVEALEQALAQIRETSTGRIREVHALSLLAEAHLGQGELGPARERAQEARDLARVRLARIYEIDAELALARVALRADGAKAHGEAEASLARAEALVEETEARGLAPRILEVRAELAQACGAAAARADHLRAAHRLYDEMGATGHARRLAKVLGLA
jgi:tetratricopeptide (TPR) repeat protein